MENYNGSFTNSFLVDFEIDIKQILEDNDKYEKLIDFIYKYCTDDDKKNFSDVYSIIPIENRESLYASSNIERVFSSANRKSLLDWFNKEEQKISQDWSDVFKDQSRPPNHEKKLTNKLIALILTAVDRKISAESAHESRLLNAVNTLSGLGIDTNGESAYSYGFAGTRPEHCEKFTLFELAISKKDWVAAKHFLEEIQDLNEGSKNGSKMIPLVFCLVENAPNEIISLIVQKGAKVDLIDRHQTSAAIHLVKNIEQLKILSESQHCINWKVQDTFFGKTPLHKACERGDIESIESLLEKDAHALLVKSKCDQRPSELLSICESNLAAQEQVESDGFENLTDGSELNPIKERVIKLENFLEISEELKKKAELLNDEKRLFEKNAIAFRGLIGIKDDSAVVGRYFTEFRDEFYKAKQSFERTLTNFQVSLKELQSYEEHVLTQGLKNELNDMKSTYFAINVSFSAECCKLAIEADLFCRRNVKSFPTKLDDITKRPEVKTDRQDVTL